MAAEEANNNGGGISTVHHKFPAVANPMAEKPSEIASNISYHALFSPHFSPFKFEPEQAYYATAESVRDRLIQVPFLITTIQFTQTSFAFSHFSPSLSENESIYSFCAHLLTNDCRLNICNLIDLIV